MSIIVKTAPRSLTAGDKVNFDERPMYQSSPLEGDDAFIWLSKPADGLYAKGKVVKVRSLGNIDVEMTIVAQKPVLSIVDLEPFLNGSDSTPLGELSRKLYKHSHHKVAGLSDTTSAYLSECFQKPS